MNKKELNMKQPAQKPEIEEDGTYVQYGMRMYPIGIGKYPYDCIAKDKHPGHMIYKTADGCVWDHRPVENSAETKQEKGATK